MHVVMHIYIIIYIRYADSIFALSRLYFESLTFKRSNQNGCHRYFILKVNVAEVRSR